MQRPLASSLSLELRADLDREVPDILGDRDRLLQVFENLIGNAIKFTNAGGCITVGGTSRDQEVIFRVADTALALRPRTCLASLTDSGKRPARTVKGPGSAFPSPRASSRLTAVESGSRARPSRGGDTSPSRIPKATTEQGSTVGASGHLASGRLPSSIGAPSHVESSSRTV
jgi:hypothetical protein